MVLGSGQEMLESLPATGWRAWIHPGLVKGHVPLCGEGSVQPPDKWLSSINSKFPEEPWREDDIKKRLIRKDFEMYSKMANYS